MRSRLDGIWHDTLNLSINPLLSISKAGTKLPQLDIIRAFSSLAVAVFHLGGKTLPFFNYGWLGVQCFFVLSGFVICWSLPQNYKTSNFRTFIWKRIARIEPPYLVSIALILIFNYVNATYGKEFYNFDLKNILFHFAYLNSFLNEAYLSPVFWTLGIEFQFYLVIGLLFSLISKSTYALVAFLLIFTTSPIVFQMTENLITTHFSLFALGIATFFLFKENISCLVYIMIVLFSTVCCYYINGGAQALAGILTLGVILFFQTSNFIIDFFSKISFSLYLTHDIIGSQLVIFLGNSFSNKNVITKAFSFSIGLGVSILFAYLFYILVEKVCLKWSKKISYTSDTNSRPNIVATTNDGVD